MNVLNAIEIIHLKMVKMLSLILCIFYHNKKLCTRQNHATTWRISKALCWARVILRKRKLTVWFHLYEFESIIQRWKNRTVVFGEWRKNQLEGGVKGLSKIMEMFYIWWRFGLHRCIHLSKFVKWDSKVFHFTVHKFYLNIRTIN